ncbi:hypothetical protein MHU86_2025 [Fragilaria crotonensis]|nr:hypothetical protein MHU86_2025 [Fragilaria crotonensis]
MNSPQTRRLSMPMGLSMPTQSQRGEDSLDELTDILKEDVDLFDCQSTESCEIDLLALDFDEYEDGSRFFSFEARTWKNSSRR